MSKGPFPVGKVSYKIELPPRLKIQLVFQVSCLKSYHADNEDPSRGESSQAPMKITTSHHKEVEYIMAGRIFTKKCYTPRHEYLGEMEGTTGVRNELGTGWETMAIRDLEVPWRCHDEGITAIGGGERHNLGILANT